MAKFTTNWANEGSLFLSEDDPVRGRMAELYLVLFDPATEEDQATLAVPASLLVELWPELGETLTVAEEKLRAFGL